MAKKNDLLQEGPGPVKDSEKPRVASFRGDNGESGAKGSEETKDVHYER